MTRPAAVRGRRGAGQAAQVLARRTSVYLASYPERGGAGHRSRAAPTSSNPSKWTAVRPTAGRRPARVSAGGLIGSVSSVSSHLATVTLLDDPSVTVGVRVVGSGVVGAAVGEGEGNPLQVEDVNVG